MKLSINQRGRCQLVGPGRFMISCKYEAFFFFLFFFKAYAASSGRVRACCTQEAAKQMVIDISRCLKL